MINRVNNWAVVCLMAGSFLFAGCEKETDGMVNISEEQTGGNGTSEEKDGYFTASFILGSSFGGVQSRVVEGYSSEIQSLQFLIYVKDKNTGKYKFSRKGVVEQFKPVANSYQSYKWPLEYPVVVKDLPFGDYKVVFLGNVNKIQFDGQATELISDVEGDYDDVLIIMPNGGPKAFDEKKYNLYYMAVADFSNMNPCPSMIMRRIVSKQTFARDFVNTKHAIDFLVNSIVKQVSEGQLTTDLVSGLLTTELTKILTPIQGITAPITEVVDKIVNILLGDLVTLLNEALLEQVTELVYKALKADLGSGSTENTWDILLNPWAPPVSSANVTVTNIPKSIGFDRKTYSYIPKFECESVSLEAESIGRDETGVERFAHGVSFYTLGGNMRLESIMVNDNGLLSGAIAYLDGLHLDGLLVNATTPISYKAGNNLAYTTKYELLGLSLTDDGLKGESISINADLESIINVERLTDAILGDGILSGILGGVVGGIVNGVIQPVVDGLLGDESLLKNLNVNLPNIGLGNIRAEGRWGATHVSDGTIVSTEIGK